MKNGTMNIIPALLNRSRVSVNKHSQQDTGNYPKG
ncbi:hypothetical protein B6N60_04949 [Richelia sinica FACHB-800]|uniref:Uncharacterized protein n=1 Tax=Richelia sinica FACHB-800 TaxID=1357546 RepID=A0A975Y7D6_9NOST|nr:hypothetical protein B6N60_04949 [Richelia sinica FACHB-800]